VASPGTKPGDSGALGALFEREGEKRGREKEVERDSSGSWRETYSSFGGSFGCSSIFIVPIMQLGPIHFKIMHFRFPK
jgi:hypothetical protein